MGTNFQIGYDSVHLKVNDTQRRFSTQEITTLKELSWYAGQISREEAENILYTEDTLGAYLIRKSSRRNEYAVSARAVDSIKHFIVAYDAFNAVYKFGPEEFDSLAELLGFFESRPTVKYNGGEKEVTLMYPYEKLKTETVNPYEIAIEESKEGYLFKRGALYKNWKERWFSAHNDTLKYFDKRLDTKPLREVNLWGATEVKICEIDDKRNGFCLVFPWRTFYFCAKCIDERASWISFFQARINHFTALRKEKRPGT